jgi:hypothetical protein
MKTFTVCLSRDITESAVVEVQALDEDAARDAAMALAGDVIFRADDRCEGVYVSWMEEES